MLSAANINDLEAPLSEGVMNNNSKAERSSRGRDMLLGVCRFINCMTAAACISCICGLCMAITVGPAFTADGEPNKEQLLRIYAIGIAISLALVETEWAVIFSFVAVLENWAFRGVAQAFLALLTLQLATSEGSSDFDKSVRLYRKVAGLAMLGCAALYFGGGLTCIGALKHARHKRVMERARAENDLEKLDKQREELRSRLAVYGNK